MGIMTENSFTIAMANVRILCPFDQIGLSLRRAFHAPPPDANPVPSTGIRRGPQAEENRMLSKEDNDLLTRTGPGTLMGNAMRRYWLPACLASEIAEPDGAPVRVKLLGEELVAFRDSEGRIGLVEEFCPHRRVSLYFGRNEECGLRCIYHGWKFDVSGACVDQLNEPEELQFKHKVKLTAYPTCELGGIVWAYLGPADKMPPPPKFAWTQVAEERRHVTKVVEECNWLQALEGGIDTSHAPILHRLLTDNSTRG